MKNKIIVTVLLSTMFTSAFAKETSKPVFDEGEFQLQAIITGRVIGVGMLQMTDAEMRKLTSAQRAEIDRDPRKKLQIDNKIRHQYMKKFDEYIGQCFNEESEQEARVCAYRNIFGQRMLATVMKKVGDKQQPQQLHSKTIMWMQDNPKLAGAANKATEIFMNMIIKN